MSPKRKKIQYSIVGLLGTIEPPLSRLVPILQNSESDRVFTFGEDLNGSFSASEMDELVEAGHVVKLPKPYRIDELAPKMKPEVTVASQLPFSLPFYALYLDTSKPEIESLKGLLDFGACQDAVILDEKGHELRILPTPQLIALFRGLFGRVERDLDDLLIETKLGSKGYRQIGVRDTAAWEKASLLMELAYDYRSSEQAITYGALLRMSDLREDAKWYYWTSLACKVWGVKAAREHWLERIRAKWDAIQFRARPKERESKLSLLGDAAVVSWPDSQKTWAFVKPQVSGSPLGSRSSMKVIISGAHLDLDEATHKSATVLEKKFRIFDKRKERPHAPEHTRR